MVLMASRALVHGELARVALGQLVGEAKVRISPLPLVAATFGELDEEALSALPNRHSVLFFGRIRPYKALGTLADALTTARNQVPDIDLVVAGEGQIPEGDAAKLGQARASILNRLIRDEEIPRLLLDSRALVLPYTDASYSAVAALAFHFGRPVIATRVGGLSETIRDGFNGILVTPGSVDELAAAMVAVMDRVTWARMNKNILEERVFTWPGTELLREFQDRRLRGREPRDSQSVR